MSDPICEMCKQPASRPGVNDRGDFCPCRCHPELRTPDTEEDPYHVARFTGGEP
jgi:hypothetical protein